MAIWEKSMVDFREEMALRGLDRRFTVQEVAEQFGVTAPTVRLWRDRYRMEGREGLEDHSHATRSCPHRTAETIETLIVEERKRWGWGSKKILDRLQEAYPGLVFPKRATVDAILCRNGLVKKVRRQRNLDRAPFMQRYQATEAGELTTIDHKGEFRLRNGRYCYPLTMMDRVSRYLLACEALTSTSFEQAWPVIERVFREHGLPSALQSDNGPPFGSSNGRFSQLSVRLMSLGIQPVFSRPGCPQDNGSHERMHRDLKADTTRPPETDSPAQQKAFDRFCNTFNFERPHEGIGMKRPGRVYFGSPRPYPRRHEQPQYDPHLEKRKVSLSGSIRWLNQKIYIGHPLAGQTIGLEATDEGIWTARFYSFKIGKIDERTAEFI